MAGEGYSRRQEEGQFALRDREAIVEPDPLLE